MTWSQVIDLFVVIYIIIFGICALTYIPRVRAYFHAFKKQEHYHNKKNNKIAIIVPARNESKVIPDLIDSLKKQTYGKSHFDVHILVKESTDPTIELVKEIDGHVHIIPDQTCKGDAIEGCLQSILKETPNLYDSYLIIDADCVLEEHMLEEMNNAMMSGRDVIQAKKIVKNYLYKERKANTLASCCNGLIWPLIDDLGNRYKSDNNITNMTIGTGIMISSRVIKEIGGWPYRKTLTEDIEFMYDCVLKNFTTYYCTYAKLYVEEATSLSVTNKRRTRWMTGVVDSYRLYSKALKEKKENVNSRALRKNIYYTTALQYIYIFIANILVFMGINLGFTLGFAIAKNPLWIRTLSLAGMGFGLIYLGLLFMSFMCVLVDWKNIKLNWFKKILLILVHPFFYMGYIRIVAKALLGKNNKGWEVIDRVDFNDSEEKKI